MTTESHPQAFQAEVRQLLDIVVHSLYTDREIFIRELVSNASDSMEKLQHVQATEKDIFDPKAELKVDITTDEDAGTLTIQDYGIGMTHEELVENLGTIAHSGTKAFLEAAKDQGNDASALIGRFGVGFYSVFMAAESVEVFTHSWRQGEQNLVWKSDGVTGYSIEEVDEQNRGCKLVIKLKEEHKEFAKEERVKGILKRYSNFVQFPILVNGTRVNEVEALWLKNKSEITDEQYNEFYKFAANAFDEPRYRMHFSADAPLALNALVFAPDDNMERMGFGQTEPGVALYCRRVLIDEKPEGLLPDWLRFLRGVIDSADLPLNISRESMQDSALVKKIGDVVTKRFLKHLDKESTKDAAKYKEFYERFSRFIKEGLVTDYTHKDALAKLLRAESSMHDAGELTSLADYVTRMKDGQEEIYYQNGTSRDVIEAGPYVEGFKARGVEVLYFYEPIDEYVLNQLTEFDGKKLVSVARADAKVDDIDPTTADEREALSDEDLKSLSEWLKETLGDKVTEVRGGKRLVNSPAAAMSPQDEISPQMRQMFKAMGQDAPEGGKVELELNPRHDLVKKLNAARDAKPELAKLLGEQLLDQSLLSAGLLEDQRALVERGLKIMEAALD
ncbi:molecular chaperone HtpG [Sulfuriroseicoccus oceanibius]|uniref:Chaperone protein HtpG n=1 Tax=Sulfuriroseicoccus oceanibius TaxID=2707525 RepID=A0A6B3L772_9BACT|nr:molecular chaperone HtpG [Sulfuriroseicoccus oceanibius]QQL44012.1 molecular chaperone HtpG [Sulfuriroseicoccus oceanibius]